MRGERGVLRGLIATLLLVAIVTTSACSGSGSPQLAGGVDGVDGDERRKAGESAQEWALRLVNIWLCEVRSTWLYGGGPVTDEYLPGGAEDPEGTINWSDSWRMRSSDCGDAVAVGRQRDGNWVGDGLDPWVFIRMEQGGRVEPFEGWANLDHACRDELPGGELEVTLICRLFVGDESSETRELADALAELEVIETGLEAAERRAALSLPEQVDEALCQSEGWALMALPGLRSDDSPGAERVRSVNAKFETVAELDRHCDGVEILGRLGPEIPYIMDEQIYGPTRVPGILFVRLTGAEPLEGWLGFSVSCALYDTLPLCSLKQGPIGGTENPMHQHWPRLMEELRAVPVVEPVPLATEGLPDLHLWLDAPRVGGECRDSVEVHVENIGTAAAGRIFSVTYGPETFTIEFFRGLEPGEKIQLDNVDYELVVTIDSGNDVTESDESNNSLQAPPKDPSLRCISVPG